MKIKTKSSKSKKESAFDVAVGELQELRDKLAELEKENVEVRDYVACSVRFDEVKENLKVLAREEGTGVLVDSDSLLVKVSANNNRSFDIEGLRKKFKGEPWLARLIVERVDLKQYDALVTTGAIDPDKVEKYMTVTPGTASVTITAK